MGLADAIRNATSGVVPRLLSEFAKSVVTTTRYASTRDLAGRPARTPSHPVSGQAWYIKEITEARAQRVWSATVATTAEAALPLDADVQQNDVVHVDSGDFAGTTYEVVQLRRDPNGSRLLVALGPTGQQP